MYQKFLWATLTVVFALSFAGCDSGGSDDNDPGNLSPGTFTVEVTGAEAVSSTGIATSAGAVSSGGWGVVLAASTGGFSITFVTSGDRPSTGTKDVLNSSSSLSDPDDFIASVVTSTRAYASTGGTVDITSSSSSSVQGTFTFTASDGGSNTITATGSFRSNNVTVVTGSGK